MAATPITVFYDGECALCHGWVGFLIARDSNGDKFIYAPLQSEFAGKAISAAERAGLPDSVIVRTKDGCLLVKSAAVVDLLERIGGGWNLAARILKLFPRSFADAVYDAIARRRRRLFGKPLSSCPVVPLEMVGRFRP